MVSAIEWRGGSRGHFAFVVKYMAALGCLTTPSFFCAGKIKCVHSQGKAKSISGGLPSATRIYLEVSRCFVRKVSAQSFAWTNHGGIERGTSVADEGKLTRPEVVASPITPT